MVIPTRLFLLTSVIPWGLRLGAGAGLRGRPGWDAYSHRETVQSIVLGDTRGTCAKRARNARIAANSRASPGRRGGVSRPAV
eukprot:2987830-Prymnesium_polylepis.2